MILIEVREKRIDQIPVVRRTIIVEPYPDHPSTQIVVKPKGNMVGKVRLGENNEIQGQPGDTIIYPTTAFAKKRSKPKKKSTVVNNNVIEDLNFDNLYDDYAKTDLKTVKKTYKKTHITNAFYN